MPAWLMILQVVIPLVKSIVDMIRGNPPAADAPQAHKDVHAAILGGAEAFHTSLVETHEAMKA